VRRRPRCVRGQTGSVACAVRQVAGHGAMAARERWKLLGETLRGRPRAPDAHAEVTRRPTGSYGLVLSTGTDLDADGVHESRRYAVPLPGGQAPAVLSLRQRRPGAILRSDLDLCDREGIDNTGVVCLWPAEEVLTHYAAARPELFAGRRVLELGAGVGLAGLALAAVTDAACVHLTDGNSAAVEALRANVEANRAAFGRTVVTAGPLYWGRGEPPLLGRYDVVVAADCTFFEAFHGELAETLRTWLAPGGVALLFNPRRGGSLDRFVAEALARGVALRLEESYDGAVSARHAELTEAAKKPGAGWPAYTADTCYPVLARWDKPPLTRTARFLAAAASLAAIAAAVASAARLVAVHRPP